MKVRTNEDYQMIGKNMMRFGDPFFQNIGRAIFFANSINRQKLANNFARDFARFENFGKQ